MSLNGKFLDKDHLQYFWTKIKMKFASAEQGAKADTALQQSDVSSTYSATGTAPVNGTAVNAAIGTLDVSSIGGSGKYISAISETDGKIAATPTTFDTSLSSSSTNNNAPTTKAVYDDQQRQETEIGVVANAGAKNLFDINTSLPLKIYHTTYTLSDGSLTVTSNGSWGHCSVPVNLPAGNYIFTATISNFSKDPSASATSVRMRVTDTTATGGIEIASKAVTGNGAFELPFTWTGGQCYIQYYLNYTSTTTYVSSFTASNSMIRPASITDSTFQPYALPNPTLTPAAIKAVDEGAKNLFRFNSVGRSSTYGASYTQNGITVTVNSDVGLTVSGTAGTGGAFVNIGLDSETPHLINTLCDGQHILSGGSAKARLNARANSQTNYSVYDTGNGVVLTATSYTGAIFVSVSVEEGVSFSSSETIYPMICTAQDWAVSQKLAPYAPTNRALYTGEFQSSMTSLVDNLNVTFIDKANSRLNVYKYGKICFADISLKTNASALTGSDTITATALPSELRPTSTFYATLMARDSGTWALANLTLATITIDANGAATLRTGAAHSSAEYITGYISWLSAK